MASPPYSLEGRLEPEPGEVAKFFQIKPFSLRKNSLDFNKSFLTKVISPPRNVTLKEKKVKGNKSSERGLNLSGSWHKGHSHAYNTLFFI
jgi:hypothetical protein